MKIGIRSAARIAMLALVGLTVVSSAQAQGINAYWTNSPTLKLWNSPSNNWSTTSGGAADSTWPDGFNAIFNVANSTITGSNIFFSSIIANQNVTVTGGGVMGLAGLTSTVDVASGMTFDFGTQNFLASTFGITKAGAGTLVLNNANAYTGGFTLNAGTVTIGNVNALGSGGALNLNGGTLQASSALDLSGKYTSINVGGNFTVGGSNALTFSSGVALGGTARTITNSSSANTTFNGVITGTGGLTLNGSGAGTVIFGGANSYSGGTTISSGTLQVGNGGTTGQLGAGAVANNGTLAFNRTNSYGITQAISGTGAVTFSENNTGQVYTLSGANTYSGTTTVNSGANVQIFGTAGTFGSGNVVNNGVVAINRSNPVTVGNTISGSGGVGFGGGSTVTVTANNSYSGGSEIAAGTTVNVGNGGATGSLGSGSILNDGNLTFNRSGSTTVGNTITGAGQTVFSSGGTYTVTGNNTYAGGTTIAGTVLANNATSSLGSGVVTVASGGTLSGTGAVAAPVTVASGGTIAPGASPGILTVNGDVVFQAGSKFAAELNGTTPGALCDQLVVNGAIDLGSADLLLGLGYAPTYSDFFYLILNDGADSVTGSFSGYLDGGAVYASYNGTTYQGTITFQADSSTSALTGGNDVAVTGFAAIPEPASFSLVVLTLIPAFLRLSRPSGTRPREIRHEYLS